jgi:diadenosine tetraphosphate (Ap4A) HIT family hydrolase
MKTAMPEECLVCRKHRGEVAVPGGPIYQDELLYICHAMLRGGEVTHYLGHVFVETKRHVGELADLTEAEAQRLGLVTSRAARALMETLGMEHVYSFVIGDDVPHVHVHVIGRYPGAPREYRGPRVDDWPDAPRGGDAEMAGVSARLREFFESTWPR